LADTDLRYLNKEYYIGLLQTGVSKKPARLAPMTLNVGKKRWSIPNANMKNIGQSTERDEEIKRQVDFMEAYGLKRRRNPMIQRREPCYQRVYSQHLLTR